MNNHSNKLLHFALIILLMIAPLRSVFATQMMACDMETTSTVAVSADYFRHGSENGSLANSSVADMQDDFQVEIQAKSCCDSNSACMSDCHFAISASVFIQMADYSPAMLAIDTFDNVSSSLIVRELSPPSRPPLLLYS